MKNYLGTLSHCLITFICCFVGIEWLCVGFYFGRELAQAEYRYIGAHGGKRYNCPWYCGFYKESWTLKGILDFILPLIIVILFNYMR